MITDSFNDTMAALEVFSSGNCSETIHRSGHMPPFMVTTAALTVLSQLQQILPPVQKRQMARKWIAEFLSVRIRANV